MTRPPASPVGAAVGGAVEVAPCRGAGAVWQQTIARAVAPNIARRRASRTGRSLNAGSEPGLTLFWHKTRLPQISGAGAWSALRASRPSRESTGRVSMRTRTRLLVAAVSALALVASACGGSAGPGGGATSAKTVKILSSLPMTGASRTQTVEIVNSIQMAIADTKINNVTVQFEALDDATAAKGSWDAAQEAENARKAINDKSVVAYIGTYNSGALANKIKDSGADFVYYGGIVDNNPAVLAKDLKAVAPNIKFMGPDGINCSEFLKQAGPAGDGVYSTFGGVPPEKYTGKSADWLKAYDAKYQNKSPNAYAIYGYEAAKVVLAAIAKAGDKADDRATVLANGMGTKDYEGVLGKWSFDANGDTTLTQFSGSVGKGGAWVFEKELAVK